MVTWVFWVAVATIAYVYVGYPLLLAAWARLAPRPVAKGPRTAPLPGVSIVVAARNEGARIAARLENLLSLDYPAPRQIIVVSDGSTDNTVAEVQRFSAHVELVTQPPHGKAAALNAGVKRARHPLLAFADARQRFARDVLQQLAANFADDRVGAVSGELILDAESGGQGDPVSTVADGLGLYWRYEKWLRRREGRVASTLGVTGAVYAMRRDCWKPLPPDTILDDVLAPMRVVLDGRRVVFDETALAFDAAAPDAAVESRRKVRTLAGNYQLIWFEPRLLLPVVNPVWVQFVSHKVGRLLVPYALVASATSSALLAGTAAIYTVAFLGHALVAVLAGYGAYLDAVSRPTVAARPVPVAFADEERSRKRVVNA